MRIGARRLAKKSESSAPARTVTQTATSDGSAVIGSEALSESSTSKSAKKFHGLATGSASSASSTECSQAKAPSSDGAISA
jgi:hypothetical protein